MKKLLSIVVLGLLLSGNAYTDTNLKKYFINKKDKDNVQFNKLADNWNNFLKQMDRDRSCNSIAITDTPFTDLMDCIHRNIKKYMRRNGIDSNQRIVNAFYDYYEDAFVRAKNIQIQIILDGPSEIESDVHAWGRYIDNSLEDTAEYSKNIWIKFAEKISSKDNSKSKKTVSQSGSGFFINNKGYFVTNNHVVEGCIQSKITFNEKSVDAELIAKDETLDLALLRANVKPKDYLNISDDPPEKMQKVFVAGYPFGKGLSDDLKFSQGIISSIKGFGDNSNQIQIDAAINSGNSGGPIVNEDGDLVAVAVSGLDKSKSEGIGFGIKASSVKNFLEVNEAKYSSSSLISFGMSNKKLNKLMEASAVYTFCN